MGEHLATAARKNFFLPGRNFEQNLALGGTWLYAATLGCASAVTLGWAVPALGCAAAASLGCATAVALGCGAAVALGCAAPVALSCAAALGCAAVALRFNAHCGFSQMHSTIY